MSIDQDIAQRGQLTINRQPVADTTQALVRLGTKLSSSHASGTYYGINATAGYGGYLAEWQVNGTSKFRVDADGNLTLGNLTGGAAGTLTMPTIYGSAAANGDLTIHGTSNATRTTSDVIIQPTAGRTVFGASSASYLFDVQGSGTGTRAASITPSLTPGLNASGAGLYVAPTLVEHSSGTHAILAGTWLAAPTVTAGAGAVTAAATLYIADAINASGATNYAVWIDSGATRFDGTVSIGGSAEAILEIGANATGNRTAYIDFIGDDTYTDYGLRLSRGSSGANSESAMTHRGTGGLFLIATDAGYLMVQTSGSDRLFVGPTGLVGIGETNPATLVEMAASESLTGDQTDDYAAALTLDPAYIGDGIITTVAIGDAGTGYTVGDDLTIADGTGGTVNVDTIGGSGEVTGVTVTAGGTGYETGVHATTGGTGSAATINVTALTARTVTRHNYLDVNNVAVSKGAAVTNAALLRLDAALGTHAATTNTDKTGNAKSGTLVVNVNGTLFHIQLYANA